MRISQKADYALRAMLELARQPANQTVRSADVAQRQAIPEKFLEMILVDLRRAGLVQSQRGQAGGHRLARAAERITVGAIWRAMDGQIAEAPSGDKNGPFAYIWRQVDEAVNHVVDNVSLDDLRKRVESGQTVPDFDI